MHGVGPFDKLRTGLLDSRLRGNDGLGPFGGLRVSGFARFPPARE